MIDQTIIDRSNAAKRLQNNTDFIEIIAAIEADIFASFRAVKIGDSDTLNTVHSLSHGFKLLNERIAKYQEIANYERNKENFTDE